MPDSVMRMGERGGGVEEERGLESEGASQLADGADTEIDSETWASADGAVSEAHGSREWVTSSIMVPNSGGRST